jgi:hypothetical protein
MNSFPTSPEDLANEIGIPLKDWPLNCHGIATAVLQMVPVEGMRLARGHYDGYVSPKSEYRSGAAASQHSWLVAADGRIVDPTRWAMETPDKPYIYIGESDVYDEGGLAMTARIPPMFPMSGPSHFAQVLAKLPLDKLNILSRALKGPVFDTVDIDSRDLRNLADHRLKYSLHIPPDHHDDPVALYSALADAGLKAMIKIDLWNRVMEPEKLMRQEIPNRWFALPEQEKPSDPEFFLMLCCRFISIEERDLKLEGELEELGYTLDEWHDHLNRLESHLKFNPEQEFRHIPSMWLDPLVVVSSFVLGSGYGVGYKVESYAASYGYDRKALDQVLRTAGDRAGYDNSWV